MNSELEQSYSSFVLTSADDEHFTVTDRTCTVPELWEHLRRERPDAYRSLKLIAVNETPWTGAHTYGEHWVSNHAYREQRLALLREEVQAVEPPYRVTPLQCFGTLICRVAVKHDTLGVLGMIYYPTERQRWHPYSNGGSTYFEHLQDCLDYMATRA